MKTNISYKLINNLSQVNYGLKRMERKNIFLEKLNPNYKLFLQTFDIEKWK